MAPLFPRETTPRAPSEDDSLDELPPIDGSDDEREDGEGVDDVETDDVREDAGDPFDDATSEGQSVPGLDVMELDISGSEAGWLVDANDAETLDVGAADVIGADDEKSLLADNDELGVGEEDFGLGEGSEAGEADAGEEGPDGEDEALREEDLPRLDADEDGEGDDAEFFDALKPEDEGARRPEWSTHPWHRVVARHPLGSVHALACTARGVLAAGAGLAMVDLEGACETLVGHGLSGGDVTGIRFDGTTLAVTTERGGVFVSLDGGATFVETNGWRALVSAREAASGIEVALGSGELWGRTAQGKLLHSKDSGHTWLNGDSDGFVLAVAVDDAAAPVALVRALTGVEVLRGAGGALDTLRLSLDSETLGPDSPVSLAARGAAVAVGARGAGIFRTLNGSVWSRIEGVNEVAALSFIDAMGTLLAVIPGDDDRLWLVRIATDGDTRVVAALDTDTPHEGTIALAWDEAHGVAWIAGGFGLAAFQPAMAKVARPPDGMLPAS